MIAVGGCRHLGGFERRSSRMGGDMIGESGIWLGILAREQAHFRRIRVRINLLGQCLVCLVERGGMYSVEGRKWAAAVLCDIGSVAVIIGRASC